MPVELLRAIEHAFWILDLRENLTEEELPEEWMWPFSDAIERHLEGVDRSRREKYGGSPDRDEPYESPDPEHWTHNEMADSIRG